jgi:hypothetical protein
MQVDQSITLSEHQQKRVWEGWIGAEIRGCYFVDLVAYYQLRQRTLSLLVLIASSGAALAIAAHWSEEWPKLVLALSAAVLSFLRFVLRDDEQALKCSDLHVEWNRLANDYERVWENMYAENAEARLHDLNERALELSKSGASIPDRDKRLLKCQQYVEMHHGL